MSEDNEKSAYEMLEDIKESVREQVRERIDEYIKENPDMDKEQIRDNIDYDGQITEIYDGNVPIYNSDIMKIGSLPEVYQHENELGPAFDGSPTAVNIIAGSIYEILSDIAWEEINNYLDKLFDYDYK